MSHIDFGETASAVLTSDLLGWLKGPDGRPRRRRYFLVAALGSAFIWALALAVVWLVPRVWAVDYTLILPSSDPDGRVSLNEVGQAYATSRSTYDGKSLDPRVNYLQVMKSADVQDAAAKLANVSPAQFGAPRIKLIDQSSVIEVQVRGGSAAEALRKAQAMNDAFNARLAALRADETRQRELAIEQTILNSRYRLTRAQQDLLKFKVQSRIISEKQLEEVALMVSQLEQKSVAAQQRLAGENARMQSLARQLGLSPQQAGWTLTLQADAVFMDAFRQFGEAESQLTDASHKWGDAHPKVREARGVSASASEAMLRRARAILSSRVSAGDLQGLAMILQDRSRDALLNDLVRVAAEAAATQAELKTIEGQQAAAQTRMPGLAEEAAQLGELERNVNFTEAVFTGVAGKTDMGNTNVYSSYPLVQMLVSPSLPRSPASPKPVFVALGAMGATLMLLVALSLAWLRAKR
jgi:uncharacterized protein involved in exopolysaccharide biosynthesis